MRPFLLALLVVSACGKNSAVKDAEHYADEICACEDAKCAREIVARDYVGLLGRNKHAKGTPEDAKAIEAAGQRMAECMKKLK